MQPQSYEPGVFMAQVLIKPEQNAAVQMLRELGPFEHLLWLVDQWTPRNFALVSRIEGSSVSVESLGAALLQVQHRHPILRTAIHVNGDGRPEFTPTSAPIWLQIVRSINFCSKMIPRSSTCRCLFATITKISAKLGDGEKDLVASRMLLP